MAEHAEPDVQEIDEMDVDDDDADIPEHITFGFAVDKASKTYIVDHVDHGKLTTLQKERLQAMTRAEYEQMMSLAEAVANGRGPKITVTVLKNAHRIAPLASGPKDFLHMLAACGDKVRDKHHDGKHDGMVVKTARQALKEERDCKLCAMQQVLDLKPDAQGVYPSTITVNKCEGINSIEILEINTSTHGGLFVGTRTLTPEEVELRSKTDDEIQKAMDAVREAFRVKFLRLGEAPPRPYRGLDWTHPAERAAIKKGVQNLETLEKARAIAVLPLPQPPAAPSAIDVTAQKYQGEQGMALLQVDKRQRASDVARYKKEKAQFDETLAAELATRKKHKQAAFRAMRELARRFPHRGRYLQWLHAAEEALRTRSVPKRNDEGQPVTDDEGQVVMMDVVKSSYKVVDVEARKAAALQAYQEARQKKHTANRTELLEGILATRGPKSARDPALVNSMAAALASKSSSEDWQQYKQLDMRILSAMRRTNLDETRQELEVVSDQAVKDQLQKEQDEIVARKAAAKLVPWAEEEAAMNQDRVDELEEISNAVKEGRYEEYKELMEADATLRQIMTDEAELATLERGSVDYLLMQMKIRTDRWKYAKCKLPIKHTYARKQPPVLERPSFFAVLQHGLPKRAESNADDVFGTASAGEGAVTVAAGPSKRARK